MSDLTRSCQYHKKQILSRVLIISYNVYIYILDSLYGIAPRGHMSTNRVYEPIYTVKNLYNCSTARFFSFVYVYVFLKWNICIIHLSYPSGAPTIKQYDLMHVL